MLGSKVNGRKNGQVGIPLAAPRAAVFADAVQCPYLPCSLREDWGLADPTGNPDEAFLNTIRIIEEKVLDLKDRLH